MVSNRRSKNNDRSSLPYEQASHRSGGLSSKRAFQEKAGAPRRGPGPHRAEQRAEQRPSRREEEEEEESEGLREIENRENEDLEPETNR